MTGILGDDHPNALTACGNLATSYTQAGRTDEAIVLEERVLADSERILGDDHPDTLTARANLAVSYWQAGVRTVPSTCCVPLRRTRTVSSALCTRTP
ncbi:tetratricopeptide repeat protein [Kitasatospora purpeofusca]|uniref:tetratricopeptide repeat protein n=1 Tax=Kitasatospora purpeofusca TaxID=67352 RepID=UPI00365AC983